MEDLKRNRQALTATVFQEGCPVDFEGNVLKIEFPKDSDFHAREARKSRHGDALGEVLEEHFGVKPRLECRISDGPLETPASLREEAHPETSSEAAFGLEANREEPTGPVELPPEVGEPSRNAPDKPQATSSPGTGAAPDAAGLDDKIASEDEVFEMARERGLFGQDGGS
jgi:DNA polymerase-3 subunit gamma/tau